MAKNVKDLNPAEYNPRRITKKRLALLGEALKEFGDLSGVTFNIRTQRLVSGHQRVKHLDPGWKAFRGSRPRAGRGRQRGQPDLRGG